MHASIALTYFPGYFDPDQLYDIESDPHEQNNLVNDPAYESVLLDMKGVLRDYVESLPHPFPSGAPKILKTSKYVRHLFGVILFSLHLTLFNGVALAGVYMQDVHRVTNDARAASLGKTETLSSRTASSLFYNPALIVTSDRLQILAAGGYYSGEYHFPDPYVDPCEDCEVDYDHKLLDLTRFQTVAVSSFLTNLHSKKLRLYGAIGYNRAYSRDRSRISKTTFTILREPREILIHEYKEDQRGSFQTISTAICLQVAKSITIGLTLNRLVGSKHELTSRSVWNRIPNDPNQEIRSHNAVIKDEYEGYFFVFGLVYNFHRFQLGASFQNRFKASLKGISTSKVYSGVDIPQLVNLSFSFQPTPSWTWYSEIQFVGYNAVTGLDPIYNYRKFMDGQNVRLGSEYLVMGIPIRIGYYQDDLLIPEVNFNKSERFPPVTIYGFTAGSGIEFRNIFIDVAVIHQRIKAKSWETYNPDRDIWEPGYYVQNDWVIKSTLGFQF